MIAVVERVISAGVKVRGQEISRIGQGLLVLLGVKQEDTQDDLSYIVRKVSGLRVFSQDGKMSKSVVDISGELLVVSQFTLLGDARHGNRPDFTQAAKADVAKQMYEECVAAFRALGIRTQTGEFGAHMVVESQGDGPVTILLDSRKQL